jgi:hypothetical protein
LYLQYFSATDPSIERQYLDRWTYHEQQIQYGATAWRQEHLSIGSRDVYGRAPYEGDVRRDFANHVLRVRLDAALREYFKNNAVAKTAVKAQQTVNQLKSMPVKVSSKPGGGQFQFGYDVQSDASKIEYWQTGFNAGIYHPHLLSALTGTARFDELTLRVGLSISPELPAAGFSYQPGTTVLEVGLSKALSRQISTRVVQITSKRPEIAPPAEYRMEVSYQFF